MVSNLTTQDAFALLRAGRAAEALPAFERILAANPSDLAAYDGLATSYRQVGRPEDAINTYAQALTVAPGDSGVLNNMGMAYRAVGDMKSALRAFQGAAMGRPDWYPPLANLSNLFRDVGDLDRSERCLVRAMAIAPDDAELLNNLGGLRERQGRIPEALTAYRRALELKPDSARIHSNLLYFSHFDESATAGSLIADHAEFQRRHADPLAGEMRPAPAPPPAGRRLRVGYVSPDFRYHPVGQFMLPILRGHDRDRLEVFCYASLGRPGDDVTAACRTHAEHWRDIAPLTDAAAADLVRQDGIDVLVDLTMHMAGNRALLFARKPARVQLSYLAYCSTTGLGAMDYRVSDPHLDAPDTEDDYTERTLRLPRSYWCYEPRVNVAVGPLPAEGNGFVTFGNLNNINKLSPGALAACFEILKAVPRSRLILHAGDGEPRMRIHKLAGEAGVAAERIEFMGFEPMEGYYGTYNRIDIALDPFPYAGGTTSCDALYMGVPLVTLAGRIPVGRGGVSLLRNLGLPDLIAATPERYVKLAANLAEDLPRLKLLRETLRGQMQHSAVMDAPAFTRDFEAMLMRAAGA